MANMTREAFIDATANAQWASIDELRQMLTDAGYWDDEFRERAERESQNSHIRRAIRELKDADGWPIYSSVVTIGEDGRERRVYKQGALFDRDDYFQAISYHAKVAEHHMAMAWGHRDRAARRFEGFQLPLPFDVLLASVG